MELIKTTNLSKKFGRNIALDGVEISLEAGKIYGVLGPNGSGKSTLMRLISGLYSKSNGHIEAFSNPLSVESKKHIAYMPTESFFYDYMNIGSTAMYFSDFFEDFDNDRFDLLLKEMGLEKSMKIPSLSSGMNAKLRVALTMSRKATVYLIDEPLNGVDLVARDLILKTVINSLSQDNLIVLSSHQIDIIENVLDEVIFLKEGTIVLNKEAEDARASSGKSIVQLYKEVFKDA